jgi:hypothetical protein
MPVRQDGHHGYFMPEGHEAITDWGEDVVVIGRHQDGELLPRGRGRSDHSGNHLLAHPSRIESFP